LCNSKRFITLHTRYIHTDISGRDRLSDRY